jgi:endonuclease YncB( thermonuclease family)
MKTPRFAIVILGLFLATGAFSEELRGRVVSVSDGDTFTLLTPEKQQVKIRLAEIDAPESGQPYGNRSKQALSSLTYGKDVLVRVQTQDRYGRTVGRPYVGDLDVCEEMVRMGAAWAYRRYLRDQGLLTLEAEAKAQERGLWSLSEAQNAPPWEWRRSGAGNQAGACQIKGNINSKGEPRISESKGERWFCSESEARAAGWRAPHN